MLYYRKLFNIAHDPNATELVKQRLVFCNPLRQGTSAFSSWRFSRHILVHVIRLLAFCPNLQGDIAVLKVILMDKLKILRFFRLIRLSINRQMRYIYHPNQHTFDWSNSHICQFMVLRLYEIYQTQEKKGSSNKGGENLVSIHQTRHNDNDNLNDLQ